MVLVGVVLLSVAAACVAYEARFVAARKAWLIEHPQSFDRSIKSSDHTRMYFPRSVGHSIPLIRTWLGDTPQVEIAVFTDRDRQSAQALFPEAEIYECED